MPCYTTLWTYPWDLHDAGAEAAVRSMKDEIGLDGVSLAAAYHTFEMLRPRSQDRLLLQAQQAAVYFRPQLDLYDDTRIKPHVSPLMGDANWYAEAAEAAGKVGIDLVAWTVFLHNSYQAGLHPECAQVSCTGDISTAVLCPANPDVRAFAAALARDMGANYGIALLECESLAYGGFGHIHYHSKYGVELGPTDRFALSLCFCSACREAARASGLDPDGIGRDLETRVRHALLAGGSIPGTPEQLVGDVPGLGDYVQMREDTVASLLREVRDAAGVPVSFIFMGDRLTSGGDRKRMADVADFVETLSYTSDPLRTEQTISGLLPDVPSADRLLVGLQAYPPASPDADTLKANVVSAMGLGIRRFSFYNFGIMPPANLDWVREAVEAARGPTPA
ncbi:MAG: hypothetical protein QGI83_21375 [Candidatus Latescibacteria bacterium]|jgi:hypothetical protein|nr:hypothetical protein [Candidatus Latescibacterota bacterium]